jgi:hypothetical protein
MVNGWISMIGQNMYNCFIVPVNFDFWLTSYLLIIGRTIVLRKNFSGLFFREGIIHS